MMLISVLANCFVIATVVVIHYEFLYRLSKSIGRLNMRPRHRIVIGVIGTLVAHTVEVWVFALAYYAKISSGLFGSLSGNFDGSLLDCVYFSFTTFTTLGFGDIEPIGPLRFLVGLESLTGLLLIAWSASFLYFEMENHWDDDWRK